MVEVSNLTGAALDWAVAKCEGLHAAETTNNPFYFKWHCGNIPAYSTDWAQGGPIIEREGIRITPNGPVPDRWWAECVLPADKDWDTAEYCGPTPLIAAMRCYVASKLGDEIKIPKELLND